MSLSQILAAMMQSSGQAPQVTPMGAAPSGGGGGGGGVKPVTGGAIKMPSVGQTERPPPPTIEGIVTEYGLDPASQPDIYGLNAPDTTPLARQMFEATEELYRLNNPAGFGDWWDAQRGGTEKARERHAQAQQNIASFKQHQAYIANEQAKAAAENQARTTAALVAPALGQEQADAIYNAVRSNPELQGKIVEKFFQRTDPVNLEKQVNYVMGLPEGSPQKDLAMQVLLKNNGTQLSIDKDGNILFASGGEALPSQSANITKAEANLIAAEDAQQALEYLKEDFQADFLGAGGLVRGTVGGIADWTGLPIFNDSKQFAAEREDFIAENRRFVDEYRRQVTGAQASQAELARIEQRLMNAAEDGRVKWMTMFNTIIQEQNNKANRERKRLGLDPLPLSNNLVFSEAEINPEKAAVEAANQSSTGETLEGWED